MPIRIYKPDYYNQTLSGSILTKKNPEPFGFNGLKNVFEILLTYFIAVRFLLKVHRIWIDVAPIGFCDQIKKPQYNRCFIIINLNAIFAQHIYSPFS